MHIVAKFPENHVEKRIEVYQPTDPPSRLPARTLQKQLLTYLMWNLEPCYKLTVVII